MSHPLFEKHRELIEQACKAARTRGYWSPFNEMPSPKTYGENAAEKVMGSPFFPLSRFTAA